MRSHLLLNKSLHKDFVWSMVKFFQTPEFRKYLQYVLGDWIKAPSGYFPYRGELQDLLELTSKKDVFFIIGQK